MSMALDFQAKVEGLKELEANLKILREKFSVRTGGILIRGLRAGAKLMRDEAKRRVPVGTGLRFVGRGGRRSKKPGAKEPRQVRGGLIRAHIVEYAIPTSSARAGGRPTVLVRVSNRGYERLNGKLRFIRPGSSPGYWWLVEFGTSKNSAKPFMRPAFETKKQDATEVFRRHVRQEIESTFARLGHGIRQAA